MVGRGRGVNSGTVLAFLERLRTARKKLVRIVDSPTEIWTREIPNMKKYYTVGRVF
jgi:hypothetical protein